jgi:hypothetical protein
MVGLEQPRGAGLRRAADLGEASQAWLSRRLPQPSVLVGFLTGVDIEVFTRRLPDMLKIPNGSGSWFEQQWSTITHVSATNG